ncbi:MAG TPA: Hpt domain-containing protein, partial [Coleofasciculaceae cyanobacterium]
AREAHYIKGACASVGAIALVDPAKTLECQAQSNDVSEAMPLLLSLEHSLSQIQTLVQSRSGS